MSRLTHNAHHGFYPRRYYENNPERLIREVHSTVIYRNFKVAGHIALHKAVEPPPLLRAEEAADLLDYYDMASPAEDIEYFECARNHFLDQAISDCGNQERMMTFANNFSRQLMWIYGDYEGRKAA